MYAHTCFKNGGGCCCFFSQVPTNLSFICVSGTCSQRPTLVLNRSRSTVQNEAWRTHSGCATSPRTSPPRSRRTATRRKCFERAEERRKTTTRWRSCCCHTRLRRRSLKTTPFLYRMRSEVMFTFRNRSEVMFVFTYTPHIALFVQLILSMSPKASFLFYT